MMSAKYMDEWQSIASCHTSQLSLRDGKVLDNLRRFREAYGNLLGVEFAEGFVSEEPIIFDLGLFLNQSAQPGGATTNQPAGVSAAAARRRLHAFGDQRIDQDPRPSHVGERDLLPRNHEGRSPFHDVRVAESLRQAGQRGLVGGARQAPRPGRRPSGSSASSFPCSSNTGTATADSLSFSER